VMAAGAGALNVELGGPAIYHGELHERPQLGEGAPADADSIDRGWQLVQRGVWLWLLILCVGAEFYA
jgi:adenosylcobinamide-phosphate synthase